MAQPNIILIMTDDQDDPPGNELWTIMPRLRRNFWRGGMRFRNSFVDRPLCTPARASMLTGQASHNHGILSGLGFGDTLTDNRDANFLPVWMQNAGYDTCLMGKYINGYSLSGIDAPLDYVPPGWNNWQGMLQHGYTDFVFSDNGTLVTYTGSYQVDVLAAKAETYILSRTSQTKPFFMVLTPTAPHPEGESGVPTPAPRHVGKWSNLDPTEDFESFNEADVSDKPAYLQAIPLMAQTDIDRFTTLYRARAETLMSVDEMVDRIFTALRMSGRLADTVVIYTSDNGSMVGQHRLVGKHIVYEPSVRVPLLMRGPNIPVRQARVQLVNNLDVIATIVDLADATPGLTLDGKSLLPIIEDRRAAWRKYLLLQGATAGVWSTVKTQTRAVRGQTDVLIEDTSRVGTELEYYDLKSDPDQMDNRASDPLYEDRIAILQTHLTTLKTCVGDTCFIGASAAPPPPVEPPPETIYSNYTQYMLEETRADSNDYEDPDKEPDEE